MKEVLNIQNLKKSFGGITPIRDVSFSIEKQSIVLITGENGAGKTTLFNLITGLEVPTSGKIIFKNKNITTKSALKIAREGIIRLYQTPRLFKNLLVWENLVSAVNYKENDSIFDFVFKNKTIEKKHKILKNKAINLLTMFGLEDWSNVSAGELSYGQQKLVSFCMIVMNKAELALLDEPFAGLNPQTIVQFNAMVLKMQKKGMTFLIIEHNINEALKLSTNHLCLSNGEITRII